MVKNTLSPQRRVAATPNFHGGRGSAAGVPIDRIATGGAFAD